MLHDIILLYYIILYYILFYYIMLCYVIFYYIIWYYDMILNENNIIWSGINFSWQCRRIVLFLMLLSSKNEEVSQKSFVFNLADR